MPDFLNLLDISKDEDSEKGGVFLVFSFSSRSALPPRSTQVLVDFVSMAVVEASVSTADWRQTCVQSLIGHFFSLPKVLLFGKLILNT